MNATVTQAADRAIDSDGTPNPASAPMDEGQAKWLADRTHGQLIPFVGPDGQWYLHDPTALRTT